MPLLHCPIRPPLLSPPLSLYLYRSSSRCVSASYRFPINIFLKIIIVPSTIVCHPHPHFQEPPYHHHGSPLPSLNKRRIFGDRAQATNFRQFAPRLRIIDVGGLIRTSLGGTQTFSGQSYEIRKRSYNQTGWSGRRRCATVHDQLGITQGLLLRLTLSPP